MTNQKQVRINKLIEKIMKTYKIKSYFDKYYLVSTSEEKIAIDKEDVEIIEEIQKGGLDDRARAMVEFH